ncbi:MAG: hypothetical protein HZA93_24095 [Verrucomicrobia bacterium]|nr:hypothetical protein [Verrucomicrobiota bacterium]
MSHSPAVPRKQARPTRPCVCCGEREHAGIPDRDLEGYVCRECARLLARVEKTAARSGLAGCTQPPAGGGQ